MIVTIDGPAGAGKSTVAKALARRLGFRYLDTGAMYRAVALAGMRRQLDWSLPAELAELAREVRVEVRGERIFLEGEDVTETVRSPEVTAATRFAANNAAVREHLVALQRAIAGREDIVTEGRDQGSVVFPDAECKVYLTASAEERARRRVEDFRAQGKDAPFAEVLADMVRRDESDAARDVGPLTRPPDAIELVTDGLTAGEVIERLVRIVDNKRQERRVRDREQNG